MDCIWIIYGLYMAVISFATMAHCGHLCVWWFHADTQKTHSARSQFTAAKGTYLPHRHSEFRSSILKLHIRVMFHIFFSTSKPSHFKIFEFVPNWVSSLRGAYHVSKGSTLRWTFRVKDHDIGFAVCNREGFAWMTFEEDTGG